MRIKSEPDLELWGSKYDSNQGHQSMRATVPWLAQCQATGCMGGARFCQARGLNTTVQTEVEWLWFKIWKACWNQGSCLEPAFTVVANIYKIHYPTTQPPLPSPEPNSFMG